MNKAKEKDLCMDKCRSMCCTGISVPIDRPKNKTDIEELRFYLIHKNIEVYINNRRWYILVNEKCKNLGRNFLCKDYERRPLICRKHTNDECEYWGDYFDIRFGDEKELLAYLDKKKKKAKKKTVRKK